MKTHHPKIFIGKIATYAMEEVLQILAAFNNAVGQNDEQEVRRLFNRILPEASITVEETGPQPKMVAADPKILTRPTRMGLVEK